jgi:hypothetical protein
MTTGLSGTYAINAVDICPETARWVDRDVIGQDGNGHPIYPSIREFEFNWGHMSMTDYSVIHSARQLVGSTGTVTVDLPDLTQSDFRFTRYSGTIIHEPQVGEYFTDHLSNVRLLVSNIRA